jgi:hypothetical protein
VISSVLVVKDLNIRGDLADGQLHVVADERRSALLGSVLGNPR